MPFAHVGCAGQAPVLELRPRCGLLDHEVHHFLQLTADEILVDADGGNPAAAPAIEAQQAAATISPELRDREPSTGTAAGTAIIRVLAAASLSGVDNQLVLELELSCWLHEVLGAWPCRTAFTLGRGPSDELVALR